MVRSPRGEILSARDVTLVALLSAIAAIILTWTLLFAAFAGVGMLVRRAFQEGAPDEDVLLTDFWTGWATTLALLQVWSLLLPVDGRSRVMVASIAVAGWSAARPLPRLSRGAGPALASVTLLAVWFAERALAPPLNNDSGGYHLGAVRWAAEHGAVPGLANAYFRFAFDSSYFLYVALLDCGPWSRGAHHIASGLVFVVLASSSLAGVARIRRERKTPLVAVFDAFLLPALIKAGLGPDVSSPSPDAGAFAMGIVICRTVTALLDRGPTAAGLARLGLFAATALAVKLSTAGLVAGAAAAGAVLARSSPEPLRMRRIIAIVASVLLPWTVRGVILSGYPAFPIPVLSAAVAWRLPAERVVDEALWIVSWARAPGEPRAEALSGTAWLGPWARRVARHRLEVIVPLVMAGACVVLAAIKRASATEPARNLRLLLLPPAAGLALWFAIAPDPRFAGAGFWMLAAAACIVAAARRGWSETSVIVAPLFLAVTVVAAHAARGDLLVAPEPNAGFRPIPTPSLRSFRTDSGLVLFVPSDGQCWDAPLPCTPRPDRRLRLRREGRLGSGFVMGP